MLIGYAKKGFNTYYGHFISVRVDGYTEFHYLGYKLTYKKAIAYYRKIKNLQYKHIKFYYA